MRTVLLLIALLAASLPAWLAAGCAGSPNENGDEDPDSFQAVKDIHGGPFTDMMLVYLTTGPRSGDYTDAERTEIFKGHMSNMQRLADAGVLLVAGPFVAPRDKSWRGIFVLDTSSVQLARLQVETDPGVKAGVFTPRYQPVKASILLRQSGELEKAMLAKSRAAGGGEPPAPGGPPPNLRRYVMVTADDASAAQAALAAAGFGGKVVWCALLSQTVGGEAGAPRRGAVFVLDAEQADAVATALAAAGAASGLGLDGWMSTVSLMDLAPAVRTLPQPAVRPSR